MAPPDRFAHGMMIAPTGRGKGVGFVIPNLLHFTGSGLIRDVKGENFAKPWIHRHHGLKNAIWYFWPFDDELGAPASAFSLASRPRLPPNANTPR